MFSTSTMQNQLLTANRLRPIVTEKMTIELPHKTKTIQVSHSYDVQGIYVMYCKVMITFVQNLLF